MIKEVISTDEVASFSWGQINVNYLNDCVSRLMEIIDVQYYKCHLFLQFSIGNEQLVTNG